MGEQAKMIPKVRGHHRLGILSRNITNIILTTRQKAEFLKQKDSTQLKAALVRWYFFGSELQTATFISLLHVTEWCLLLLSL